MTCRGRSSVEAYRRSTFLPLKPTSRSSFKMKWELELDSGKGRNSHAGNSPVCCVVILSLTLQCRVRHEKIVNFVPLVGKCPLGATTKRPVRFPVEASVLSPDCLLRPLDHSHDLTEHQSGVCITIRNGLEANHLSPPRTRVKAWGR